MQTLVLDQGYQPHRVVSWQRAVSMLFGGKVEIVEEYDEEIRSVSITIRMPAVVRLVGALGGGRRRIRLSRANLLARDAHACQYCGRSLARREATFDHVVPRSRGGASTWENLVTACRGCNGRKAARTPSEAGMRLRAKPVQPTWLPPVVELGLSSVPDAWIFWTR